MKFGGPGMFGIERFRICIRRDVFRCWFRRGWYFRVSTLAVGIFGQIIMLIWEQPAICRIDVSANYAPNIVFLRWFWQKLQWIRVVINLHTGEAVLRNCTNGIQVRTQHFNRLIFWKKYRFSSGNGTIRRACDCNAKVFERRIRPSLCSNPRNKCELWMVRKKAQWLWYNTLTKATKQRGGKAGQTFE